MIILHALVAPEQHLLLSEYFKFPVIVLTYVVFTKRGRRWNKETQCERTMKNYLRIVRFGMFY
jgi:hypothetical protein